MSNDNPSKNILALYMNANKNKEKIASPMNVSGKKVRRYSIAEEVVLSCIEELLINKEGKEERIKHIILDSLDGKMNGIKKRIEYENIIKDAKTKPDSLGLKAIRRNNGFYRESDDAFNYFKQLANTIRQGHIYWGASGPRLESIFEHIYGCLVIIIGIQSEYDFSLDYDKIINMLLLHETEEIIIGDKTEWDITPEEKKARGKAAVKEVLSGLHNEKELHELIDEFEAGITLESQYARLCDKLEYDMQVKVYELQGRYDFANYPHNAATDSDRVQEIIQNGANGVFDVHYEYDKERYNSLPPLKRILEETKKLQK